MDIVKPMISTTRLHASQLVLAILITHLTYHTQHKEGPLLCYIAPQEALPSSALQGGHRKVQAVKPSNILSFTRVIN